MAKTRRFTKNRVNPNTRTTDREASRHAVTRLNRVRNAEFDTEMKSYLHGTR